MSRNERADSRSARFFMSIMSEINSAGAFCAGTEEKVGSGGNFHQTYARSSSIVPMAWLMQTVGPINLGPECRYSGRNPKRKKAPDFR